MSPHAIPNEVLQRQHEASDPSVSAWVSANAGSGKTYVLAQRVIRLLLAGTEPTKILCLTFTKAAAANMASTVFNTLARWTALEDEDLDQAIRAVSSERPGEQLRARARQLFALALETPGGLKVQTIHAFCTRLLQQFPFEANVTARFAVLDDATQRQLLDQTIMSVLLEAAAAPDSVLGRALTGAITAASDQSFRNVLNEAIAERDAVLGWIERCGGVDAAVAELSGVLGIEPGLTQAKVEERIVNSPIFPMSEWGSVAIVCKASTARDKDQCERLTVAERSSGSDRLRAYLEFFIDTRCKPRPNLLTQNLAKKFPDLAQRLIEEQTRVVALRDIRNAIIGRDRTHALLAVAAAVIGRYQVEKERRGVLDYDDLVDKARDLLGNVDAAWVHYKLDAGIDHVLIDEAQDTSPKQWEVVERLVAEFAAGAGARGTLKRSLFAVGDDKQSIFSFQGAEPAAFADKRGAFRRAYDAGGLTFRALEFKYSFRSLQVVLDAVDTVFREPAAFRGLTADPVPTAHTAVRAQAPGLVELWPMVEPSAKETLESWDAPFDTTSETSPRVKLARRIAASVSNWIARGDWVGDGDKRHPARPGDVLVLVRQRGALFEAVIRALKNAGVPVAGADRLVLTEHIAVMDLVALADSLLLPDDDLALACVLKSPLFGFDEKQLFDLAWKRKGSLRAALRAKGRDGDRTCAEAEALVERLSVRAMRETPFAFYAGVLGPEGGRRRMLARFGFEANDALDEFLNLALDYERGETPSLQGFVAWLRAANAEVKRDMEITRDEVRVMTVHGAKGLEAPIVILADTTTPPAGPPGRQPPLLVLRRADAPPDMAEPLVWAGRKDDDVGPMARARAAAISAAEDEYRRLLYVAMTRAADRLLICGASGLNGKPAGCWYDLISQALIGHCSEEAADDGEGSVWRYRKLAPTDIAKSSQTAPPTAMSQPPGWLGCETKTEPASLTSLSPSSAYDETVLVRSASGANRKQALKRGEVMHRLLQSLPALAPEARDDAARRHLAGVKEFSDAQRDEMAKQVRLVLEDPRFAELFMSGSRAEVPIVGRLLRDGRTIAVSGQVDRLAVTADAVLIADYKTNRPAPSRFDDVPPAYVTQLALYRAVLADLFPGKPIRAALVWTEVPDLMEISSAALDAALAAVKAP